MSINFWKINRRQIRSSKRRKAMRNWIETLEDRCLLASWSGDLPNGTHWTNSEVQILTADVNIPAGTTLTIDPGTVIKFANPSVDMTVSGKVLAQGTAGAPITFTEFRDDVGGDTNGDGANSTPSNGFCGKIEFQNGSAGSILDHVNIRYGGNSNAELEINGAGLTLSNSTVANSYSMGVRIQNASPILNHNAYLNNFQEAVSSDLTSQLVSTASTATGNSVNGIALEAGTLAGNVTWNAPDLSLYMPGTITVSAGSTLTVAAGQIVKVNTTGTNNLIVNGTLTAAGTNAAPVIFTSARDGSVGGVLLSQGRTTGVNGDWGRIEFTSASIGNVLDHTKVLFGGFDALGEVLVNGGQLTVTNSEVSNSSSSGLRIQNSDPTVTNILFQQNSIAASMDLASNPAITSVTLTNNGLNGLSVDSGSLTENGTWDDPEITYFLAGTVTVPVGKSLTIGAGQIVKMNYFGTTDLIVAGTLNAVGTADHPIIVTSSRDDSVGNDVENNGPTTGTAGDWGHLEFSNPITASNLDHFEVAYGGYGAPGELYVKGGKLTVQNSVVRDSLADGIRIEASQPTISGVTFQNNQGAAVAMDMGSNPVISAVTFSSNTVNGLSLDGGALTANGFWDDPDITYFLANSVTVPDTLTLTIGAGQIVKPSYSGTVDLMVNGALIANGTAAQPIVMTSAHNDSIGTDIENNGPSTPSSGDWGHVEFTNATRASILNHVEISYGGYFSDGLAVDRGGLLTIQNSTLRNSKSAGLRVIGGDPSLTNVDLRDNGQAAVLLDSNSSILGQNLSASGNQSDLILINGGDFSSNQTWNATGIDFQLAGSITIPQGLSLTLGTGAIFDAQENTEIFGAGTILNAGTIRKTVGPADSTIFPHVINTGSITAQSGLLILPGGIEINGSGIINGATSAILSTQQNLTGDVNHSSAGVVQPQVVFNGQGTAVQPQLLEVFSADLGNKDVGFDHNFGYGSIQVETDTYVKLIDSHDNSPGNSPEALYVENLTVAGGGTLNLNGLHVYTRSSLIDGTVVGGTVSILPDGGALSLNAPSPGKIGSVSEVDDWTIFGRVGQTVTITLSTGPFGTNPTSLPSLNFAQLQLIDSSNHVLASVASTTSGADLQLTGITLPADGTYHIHVQAAPTHSSQTGNYVLGAFDATIRVASAELNQTSTGQIDNPFRIDRWTFSAVAGQVITFNVVNTQNSSIQFDLTGPNGFIAFSNQTADQEFLTLPTSGTYTLSVHTVQQQTGAYAFRLESVSVNTLALGSTFAGPIAGSGQAQLFKVNVPNLQQLQVLLSDTSASDHNEVYVKFGSAPTRSDYQYKFNTPASANQILNIPSAAPGDWYILVYTESAAQPGTITLQVKGGSLFVNDVTPDHLGNGADQVLTLTGVGFDNTTAVSLISSNNVVFNANSVRLDQPTQVTATFNAGAVPAGTYSVRVTKTDGGTSTLTNAFTVTAGGMAHLETKVIVPNPIGLHISSTLYVQYTNSGTVAMAAPLLVLTGIQNGKAGALMTLDPALQVSGFWTSATPAGYSQSVQILASGAIPGILGPGETATVPVYYAGWLTSQWDFSRPPIYFNLGSLTNVSTDVVDWPSLKESLQPATVSDQAWDGIYANLVAQLGTTWGSVIQHLDEVAAYLGSLGQHVTDLSALWSFEIQLATGMGPIPDLAVSTEISAPSAGLPLLLSRLFGNSITARNLDGPFGKGWQLDGGWGQNLSVATDGTVTITDGTSVRQFQPDSRSSAYFSQSGDRGVLSKVSSSVYTLTDPNGLVTQFQDGRAVLLRDPSGNAITADYNSGNLSSLTSTSGQSINFTYNSSGHIASLSNSIGQTAQFTYDATNQYLLSATDVNGGATAYTYDTGTSPATKNTLLTITDATGVQQVLTYDSQGRLKTTAFQGGVLASAFSYGPAGIVTVTNPSNAATTYYYDARSLLAKVVNPLQETAFYTYNSTGNLLTVTNPAGNIYSYAYDSQGRAVQVANPLGQVTKYTYGAFNTITSVTDPDGNRTTFEFDPNGNSVSQTFADGTIESLAYDPIGQITKSTDGNGNVINYTYNSAGKVTNKHYADGSEVSFNYNAVSDLTSVVDSTGTTTLDYYSPTQLKQITYPDGSFLKYTYDLAGRRTQMVDQTGYTVKYYYDVLGRFDGLTDGSNQPIVTYAYDLNSRLQLATKGNGTSTEYTYD
ncbi:MAG: repeat protein, partial [Planctomycetaceae bacterium]|nr:repeat protein [Planctomycetaceae bacterium]